MASDWEGLSIGFADDMFTESPTWTRIDTASGIRVHQIDGRVGRQSEFEETGTGTLTIQFNDREGVVDPTNAADLDGKPIALALRDPVTDEWFPRFRGVIDDVVIELDKTQQVMRTTITAVDLFSYLSGFQLMPGQAGGIPPAESAGFVWYEATTGTVDERINQILFDTGLPAAPSALTTVFSGNVKLQDTVYSPGSTARDALRDAVNAELPTVANDYIDKYGRYAFHGRYARFDPVTVAASATGWDFNQWKAGDGTAIGLDGDRAQVRPPYAVTRSRAMIRNLAICYPQGVVQADRDGQVYEDATSRAAYGTQAWSAESLIISEGSTTGNTADVECLLYATYIVENYKDPRNRVNQLTFLSLLPTDARAAATWGLITGVDISDTIDFVIDHPGGGGISETFYVEGLSWSMRPGQKDLDTGFPFITMTADLSPTAYWTTDPFGT